MKIKREFGQKIFIILKICGFFFVEKKNPSMKICSSNGLFLLIIFFVFKK